MLKLLVTMSGGTTPVINATLAGIVGAARRSRPDARVLVGVPGLEGLFANEIYDISGLSSTELECLSRTPGSAFVGTTRVAPLGDAELARFHRVVADLGVRHFINIGGNGTVQQTRAIATYGDPNLQVAAAPKTVDNDLGDPFCSEVLFNPGFPSCVNYWAKTAQLLDLENIGACSHDRVLVAQTFGRETGFIAGSARVIDPDRTLPLLVLLPEDPQPMEVVLGAIDDVLRRHGRALVILSEGYPLGELGVVRDASGQVMYGSNATTAAQVLVKALVGNGIAARSCIPTVLQRQAIEDVLDFDRDVAIRLGEEAVHRLMEGETAFLVTIRRPIPGDPHGQIGAIPFATFGDYSRRLAKNFVASGAFDVTDAYLEYLQSLFGICSGVGGYGFVRDAFVGRRSLRLRFRGAQ